MSKRTTALHAGLAGSLATALLVVAAPSAPAQNLKVWRQAMIAPKADAGFFLMAARRGFAEQEGLKIEVVDVKDDQIGMRALISARWTASIRRPGASSRRRAAPM